LNSVDAGHQNRSFGDEQLDDGIVDTLVSARLLMEWLPSLSISLQPEPFGSEITVARYRPGQNERHSGRITLTGGRHQSIVRGEFEFSARIWP